MRGILRTPMTQTSTTTAPSTKTATNPSPGNLPDVTKSAWPLARPPMLLETSLPGVFAVGDVRSSSIKRVASAVGEGSTCIQLVHRALAE
jgi:thioredoxin reductase